MKVHGCSPHWGCGTRDCFAQQSFTGKSNEIPAGRGLLGKLCIRPSYDGRCNELWRRDLK